VSQWTPYVIAGLVTGAVYGLSGMGLVLTYKTSGIFNFAHPALAAVAAYAFYLLHYDTLYLDIQVSWPVAAFISVLVVGPLMGLGMELVARGLTRVNTTLQVLATIGLQLGIIGTLALLYRNETSVTFDPFLSVTTFKLLGTYVTYEQLILFAFAALSAVGMYIYFRVARLGMAMRAVVDNRDLLDLTGESPNLVSRWAWMIGCTFAAASGVLLAPQLGTLNGNALVILMISSFGAAALGLFKSLPLTFLGGLFIGVLASLSTKWGTDIQWLNNLQPALPFIVLLVVLIVTPRRKLVDTRVGRPRPLAQSYYAPWKPRVVAGIIAVGFLAAVPSFVGNDLGIWASGLVYILLILSLGLLVKESGQVSLCQTSFAAVGGVAITHAAADWGLPWLAAILVAGLIAGAVGMLVALPAIRVSGVFLALGTLGFGLALQSLVYPTSLMFTGQIDGLPSVPRPSFAESDTGFYYVMLAFVVVVSLLLVAIHQGRLGRLLRGLSDSPLALNTMGDAVNGTRVIVFTISAFIAGIAGALYASNFHIIGLETPLFNPVLSLQIFAIVMLVAAGVPWYGLAGALGLSVIPTYLDQWFNLSNIQAYLSLLFGVSAVAIAIQADRRKPAPMWLQRFCERFRAPRREVAAGAGTERGRPSATGLEVEHLTVRFGGVVAVNDLSLAAPYNRITGLIGPNGAGKTTTFNACSGLLRPSNGSVVLDSVDVSSKNVAKRARGGIGRTFQTPELWDSLTVRENVELGAEAPIAGRNYFAQLAATPRDHRRSEADAHEAMVLAGIADLADLRVGDLSTGQRRLVELARVLAGPFDVLLLDEPSSGLDKAETERFGQLLQRIVAERGTGMLLVEHDMTLVMQVCSYIYVMDFGQEIFQGTTTEVANSEIVRAAYLGSEEVQAVELEAVARDATAADVVTPAVTQD